jgi:hypothetical protein
MRPHLQPSLPEALLADSQEVIVPRYVANRSSHSLLFWHTGKDEVALNFLLFYVEYNPAAGQLTG